MTTYVYREEGCDQCNVSEVEVVETFENSVRVDPKKMYLCCFCYETHLGNILQYSNQYVGQQTLARGLIQALHIILKEVKK